MSTNVIIYSVSGKQRYSTPINEGSKRVCTLMGDDYVTLKFSSLSPIDFAVGDYADVAGENADGTSYNFGRFEIVEPQKPSINATSGAYDYELKLEAQYKKWGNKIHKFQPQLGGQECTWSLTATIDVHAAQLLNSIHSLAYTATNMSKYVATSVVSTDTGKIEIDAATKTVGAAVNPLYLFDGAKHWRVIIDADTDASAKTITYTQTNILDAAAAIAEAFDCEYWVQDNELHFGKCENEADSFAIWESGYELDNISASRSTEKHAKRIIALGATTNISTRYRKDLIFTVDEASGNTFTDSTRPLKAAWFNTGVSSDFLSEGNKLATSADIADLQIVKVSNTYELKTVTLGKLAGGIYTIKLSAIAPTLQAVGGDADTLISGTITYALSGTYTQSNADKAFAFSAATNFKNTSSKTQITADMFSDVDDLSFEVAQELQDVTFTVTLTVKATPKDGATLKATLQDTTFDVTFTDTTEVRNIRVTRVSTGTELVCSFVSGEFTVAADASEKFAVGDTFTVNSDDLLYGFVNASYFTSRYADADTQIIKNGVVETHLMLPESGEPYIDLEENLTEQEAVEDVVVFEDVFPQTTDYVREIRTVTRTYKQDDENGTEVIKSYTAWQIRGDMFETRGWSNSYQIDGTTLQIRFSDGERYNSSSANQGALINADSGKLNGWTFDVEVKRIADDSGVQHIFFEVVRDSNTNVPNEFLCPQLNDGFTLVGIDCACIDSAMTERAEEELAETAKLYVQKLNEDANTYDCTAMSDIAAGQSAWRTIAAKHPNFALGTRQSFYIADSEFETAKSGVVQKLYNVSSIAKGDTVTISAIVEVVGIDFSNSSAKLMLALSSEYGSVTSQAITSNGVHRIVSTLTVGGSATASTTGAVYLRMDYIAALKNQCASIRVSELKIESGSSASAYAPTLSEIANAESSMSGYLLGKRIRLVNNGYFSNAQNYRDSRIIGFEMALDLPYDSPRFTVGEKATYSRIGELSDNVEALQYAIKSLRNSQSGYYGTVTVVSGSASSSSSSIASAGGSSSSSSGSSIQIIATYDTASVASDANVFSAARTLQEIKNGSVAYAESAGYATSAGDADTWDGKQFDMYLDQPVKSTSSPTFVDVKVDNLTASDTVKALDVEATEEIDTPLLNTDEANIKDAYISERCTTKVFNDATIIGGTGGGWYVDENGKTHAVFDSITARETLTAMTLVISETRSVRGVIVVSAANGLVESSEIIYDNSRKNPIGYVVYMKNEMPFVQGDFVRWGKTQYDANTGTLTVRGGWYYVEVTNTRTTTDADGNSVTLYSMRIFPYKDTTSTIDETTAATNAPQEDDAMVLLGSTVTERQWAVIIGTDNSSGKGAGVSVYDAITSNSALPLPTTVVGNLDTISDDDFGQLSGNGLYARVAYIKGALRVLNADGSYTETATTAQLTALSDSITSKVESISAVNPNLLEGTGDASRGLFIFSDSSVMERVEQIGNTFYVTRNGSNSASKEIIRFNCGAVMKSGETYTLSFTIYFPDGPTDMKIQTYSNDGAMTYATTTLDGDTLEFTRTFVAAKDSTDAEYIGVSLHYGGVGRWASVQLSKLKLEKGSIATQWTNAAEDVVYNATQIQQTESSITTDVINAIDGKYIATTTQYQDAYQIINAAVANADNDASGKYVAKTSTLQTADAIVLQAESNVYGNVNRINLLSGTSQLSTSNFPFAQSTASYTRYYKSTYVGNAVTVENTSSYKAKVYEYFKFALTAGMIEKGETYTLSFDMLSDVAAIWGVRIGTSYSNGGICATYDAWLIANTTTRITVTFTALAASTSSYAIYISADAALGSWSSVTISKLKLEKGSTATQWTDEDNALMSYLEVTSDKIQSSVSAVQKTANNNTSDIAACQASISQVTQTANKISLAVGDLDNVEENLFPYPYWDMGINISNRYFQVPLKYDSDGYVTSGKSSYLNSGVTIPTNTEVTVYLRGHFADARISIYYGDWNHSIRFRGSKYEGSTANPDYTGGIDNEIVELHFTTSSTAVTLSDSGYLFCIYTDAYDSTTTDSSGNKTYVYNKLDKACHIDFALVIIGSSLNLATRLGATGIDLYNHKVTVTSDNFEVRNNSGDTTMMVNSEGMLSSKLIDVIQLEVQRILAKTTGRANPMLTINRDFDGAIIFPYETSSEDDAQIPMLRIHPDSEDSVIQFYDSAGTEVWHIGKTAAFMKTDTGSYSYTAVTYAYGLSDSQVQSTLDFTGSSYAKTIYSCSNGKYYTSASQSTLASGTYYSVSAIKEPPAAGEPESGYYIRYKYVISSGVLGQPTRVRFKPS